MPSLLKGLDTLSDMSKVDGVVFKLKSGKMFDDLAAKLAEGLTKNGFPKGVLGDNFEFIRKGDEDFLRMRGEDISFKEMDLAIYGSPARQLGPNTAELYKKISGNTLDPKTLDSLKNTDAKSLSNMKATDEWKHSAELIEQADLAKNLEKATPIPRDASSVDTLDALKKNSKQMENLENVVKKISSGKKTKFGKFITAAKVAGAGLTVALLVDAIKKHQENMNGCWVVDMDDERRCYKIRRGDRCDSGCKSVSAYERSNKDKVNDMGYIKTAGTVEHDILWSNCPPGGIRTLGELCCGGTCGVGDDGMACSDEDGDVIDVEGKSDLDCMISSTCQPNWQDVVDDYNSACPYDITSGYKINEQGVMESMRTGKDCSTTECNPSAIRIIQLENDRRIFSVQCKDVGFWDAATDFTGVDDLVDFTESAFGFLASWGPTIAIIVAVLFVLSVIGGIIKSLPSEWFGPDQTIGIDITQKIETEPKP